MQLPYFWHGDPVGRYWPLGFQPPPALSWARTLLCGSMAHYYVGENEDASTIVLSDKGRAILQHYSLFPRGSGLCWPHGAKFMKNCLGLRAAPTHVLVVVSPDLGSVVILRKAALSGFLWQLLLIWLQDAARRLQIQRKGTANARVGPAGTSSKITSSGNEISPEDRPPAPKATNMVADDGKGQRLHQRAELRHSAFGEGGRTNWATI